MMNAWTSGGDTISNLPCNVLDVILGCLPWKDAVKTSILSKSWRYKWVSRQELDFNDEFFKCFGQDEAAKRFIYQVLLVHKGPILKFRLQGRGFPSCPDIDHWMHFLSKKNIQEFTLHINSRDHSPHHLFTFQQLRSLELQNCLFHPPPGFKGFEKLTNLDLLFVTFVPSIFTNLMSKSPLLERLRLSDCTNFDTLEIDAANLKFFEFIGRSRSVSFKSAPMLEKVTVHFKRVGLLTDTSDVSVCSNFTKFFHYMPSLLGLELGGPTLEYLIKRGLPESVPTALNKIKSLNISSLSLRDTEVVSSAVYLITNCPKLQDLTIEFYPVGDSVEPIVQLLRAQSSSYSALKLQRVHANMFTGLEMEMEFMKFILASAPVLEEINLWNFKHDLFRSGKQMIDEMKEFRRASPNAEFRFDEVEFEDDVLYEPQDEVMEEVL